MSSGCGDVLSLVDLQTAKKHQIFEAEVITGKAGGVAGGADIDYATNPVTGQVQKTMPAILRDIGFTPASFDFTTGGTLGAGDRDKAVLWPMSSGGDGGYYAWKGVLPKVIPAISTPASTGGVADGAWRPVVDFTRHDVEVEVKEAEERLLGVGAKIYRGSNGQYVQNGDVVPVGTTHLSVLINGKAEDVEMSQVASGSVSGLTEIEATIGGGSVYFSPIKNKQSVSSIDYLSKLNKSNETAYLSSGGRSGEFYWTDSDVSELVAIDTQKAIYVPPVWDLTGASGAWVRQYNFGKVNVEWFGAVYDLSVNSLNDTAIQAAFSYIGVTGETLENSGIAIRLSQLIILSDNTRYNLLGPIPTKSRVLYTTLQDPNQAGGFGAYINTDSNMFEMGLNTLITARNLAFIGSELDRTPGNFRLFAPNANEDYHKVDVRFCALSGFNRMANFLGGSYVQHITDCRIENNDVAINAPNACNASDFSRNSWAYNRVHFSGSGTLVTLRDGEFAFDAAYDEVGIKWEGDGHQIEGNYMEILVDTGVGDLSDRKNVQMIRWVVNKFSDRHSGFIRNNVLDAQNRTDYPLTIGSSYGANLTFTYQPVHKNKISGALKKDISIDAGTDLVLPDLSDNGTKTINGTYRLATNKAQAYVQASDSSLINSYNISSIVKNGTGDFTITFGYPFRNIPSISASLITGGNTIYRLSSLSATAVRILIYNLTSSALVDVNFTIKAEEMSQITE